MIISRAHSFSWQIMPNSLSQFSKFHSSPHQNCSHSAAYHSHRFVSKLSSLLSKNLLLKAGVVPSYASNIQKQLSIFLSFQKWNLLSQSVLFMIVCRIAMGISRAHDFRQFSSNDFFHDIVIPSSYGDHQPFLNVCKIP